MIASETAPSWMVDFDIAKPEMRRRMTLRRLVLVFDLAGTVLVLHTVGGFILDRIDGLNSVGPALPYPPSWIGNLAVIVFTVLLFGGVVIGALPAQVRAAKRNPLAAFTAEQRGQAWRKIRGLEPVAAGEVPLLRDAATGAYAQRWYVMYPLAGVVFLVHYAVVEPGPTGPALLAVSLVLAIALILRRARHAKAFLRRTAAHV